MILRTLGLFNNKVRRGITGRKGLFEELSSRMAAMPQGTRVWFHSSSMGEFEQAKPIIAALKRAKPDVRVIVPLDGVDTFDIPVDVAERIGALPHHGDLLHLIFAYSMAGNGVEVVAQVA